MYVNKRRNVRELKKDKWNELLETIRELNIKGYTAVYIEELNVSVGFGSMTGYDYIILCTTTYNDIDLIGFKKESNVKQYIIDEIPDETQIHSIWNNGERIDYEINVSFTSYAPLETKSK